jgi:hypothetical protein
MDEKMQKVTEELEKIEAEHKAVSVDLVLRAARRKGSPLHDRFEWDDTVAAQRYREQQAAQLIRAWYAVRIVSTQQEPVRVRAVLPLPGGEATYLSRDKVLGGDRPDARALFVHRLYTDLLAWCNETVDVEEFQHLRKMILRELDKMDFEEAV